METKRYPEVTVVNTKKDTFLLETILRAKKNGVFYDFIHRSVYNIKDNSIETFAEIMNRFHTQAQIYLHFTRVNPEIKNLNGEFAFTKSPEQREYRDVLEETQIV